MVTLEARAYGLARHIQRQTGAWTIVNDVAGFIGPEVFRTSEQLERACLEDTMMAKLHGITMGLDVCATFHMGIEPVALRQVTERVVERAAPAYLMAVAGNADPMLGYMTTAFRDHPRLRQRAGREITSVMQQRLARLGATTIPDLYAAYAKAGGDGRSADALRTEARRRVMEMRERGFDLGEPFDTADARLDAIYEHARRALYAVIDGSVLRDVCASPVRVRSEARDREDYLAHPAAGERVRRDDVRLLATVYPSRRPQLQLIISDGLNANAINEQLRALLPPLRRRLAEQGCHVGASDVVVENGRVRAGYHVGGVVDAEAIVHIVGERPGTGLNTVSAYLTYGRDAAGRSRWDPGLDHSCTSAVCGIHPKGRAPEAAAFEIARTVGRILDQRRSGVTLR
jgi:ethanolamine ammonia-lyase large subunit